jgi:hypothetical protein
MRGISEGRSAPAMLVLDASVTLCHGAVTRYKRVEGPWVEGKVAELLYAYKILKYIIRVMCHLKDH